MCSFAGTQQGLIRRRRHLKLCHLGNRILEKCITLEIYKNELCILIFAINFVSLYMTMCFHAIQFPGF